MSLLNNDDAPPCPHCGSDLTSYGEYGVSCNNDEWNGDTLEDCPIVFFEEQ